MSEREQREHAPEPATTPEASPGSGRARRIRGLARRAAVPAAVIAAFAVGLWAGSPGTPGTQEATGEHAGHDHGAAAAQVWTCSMHPQIRSPEPGACPICGMDLIPVSETEAEGGAAPARVSLSDTARALARVRTTEVTRVPSPATDLRLLGRVDYDETRVRTLTAWTGGRIDRLRVAATGQRIRPGQAIAELYSPEIYSAQQDLIQAARQRERLAGGTETARAAAAAALDAARQRLRLLGISRAALENMEKAPRPALRVTIHAPFGGTVIERLLSEGSYVSPGAGLYRVADLSRLWVQLDAYETDLSRLRVGQAVSITAAAVPGETFTGRVAFIDPVVDGRTRTARVRVEVPNPRGVLRPGMFAEAVVQAGAADPGAEDGMLVVPDTAPLFTGRRSIVYVEVAGADRPAYEAREVKLGPRAGQVYPVLAGLAAGERVVIHGAFTLDADLQIRGGDSMMMREDDTAPGAFDRALAVPEGLRAQLAPVVSGYLEIQDALARDELESARGAARALHEAVAAVRVGQASGDVSRAWEATAPPLVERARALAGAADIDTARRAFEGLSDQVIGLLERFGNPLDEAVRLAFCPMALDNQGAHWVQRAEDVENSYFGASMFACGEIQATADTGQPLPARGARTRSDP